MLTLEILLNSISNSNSLYVNYSVIPCCFKIIIVLFLPLHFLDLVFLSVLTTGIFSKILNQIGDSRHLHLVPNIRKEFQ